MEKAAKIFQFPLSVHNGLSHTLAAAATAAKGSKITQLFTYVCWHSLDASLLSFELERGECGFLKANIAD